MSEIDHLIGRVEEARGPDREIDESIAAFVAGAEPERQSDGRMAYHRDGYWVSIGQVPMYTFSLDAVVALVERELPGWDWDTGFHHAGPFAYANIEPGGALVPALGVFHGKASTPALALLLAFLRALKEKKAIG